MLLLLPMLSAVLLLPMSASGPSRASGPRRARVTVASLAESIPAEATANVELCRKAADTKTEDPDTVCEALLQLEKQMREASKDDGGEISRATLAALNGAWRLGALEAFELVLPHPKMHVQMETAAYSPGIV